MFLRRFCCIKSMTTRNFAISIFSFIILIIIVFAFKIKQDSNLSDQNEFHKEYFDKLDFIDLGGQINEINFDKNIFVDEVTIENNEIRTINKLTEVNGIIIEENVENGLKNNFHKNDRTKKYVDKDISTTKNVDVNTDANSDQEHENVLTNRTLQVLKSLIRCNKKSFRSRRFKTGSFWVFENFVKAEHGELECYQDVTFATHGGSTFLEHLNTLVQRWQGPISVAIFTPGTDFQNTVNSIKYLRSCSPQRDLIKRWISFHLYFPAKHLPAKVFDMNDEELYIDCSHSPPYTMNPKKTYVNRKKLTYPINKGRNIARDASLTFYILSLDIELFPSSFLGANFLNMIARKPHLYKTKKLQVFALNPFEIEADQKIPENKTVLLRMLKKGKAVPFHKYVCRLCHKTPFYDLWKKNGQKKSLAITGIAKRKGKFRRWEAIFINTNNDPQFEESLSWEGKRDKMAQSYVMCLMDYDFLILNNAFVVHSPGIKKLHKDPLRRKLVESRQNYFISKYLLKEYILMYGNRSGCLL